MLISETPKQLKHVIVYDKLYALIRNGSFPVGYQFPSEPDLALKMGVSRVTLRRALALLQDDGLITNIRGKGNFVVDPKTQSAEVKQLKKIQHPFPICCNKKIDNIEIAFRFEAPTEYFTAALKQETSVIILVDRWYKYEDNVVGYSLSLVPIEVISENKINLNNQEDLIEFLEKTIYDNAIKSETVFSYTKSGNFAADKYNLSENDNFILISETIYSNENKVLMSNKHYIPVENFKLTINLTDQFDL